MKSLAIALGVGGMVAAGIYILNKVMDFYDLMQLARQAKRDAERAQKDAARTPPR